MFLNKEQYEKVKEKMFRYIDFVNENRAEKDSTVEWAARSLVNNATLQELMAYFKVFENDGYELESKRTFSSVVEMLEVVKEELLPVFIDFLNDDVLEEAQRRKEQSVV